MSAMTSEELFNRGVRDGDWDDEREERAIAISEYLNELDMVLGDYPDDCSSDILEAIDNMCGGYVMEDFSLDPQSVQDSTGRWFQHAGHIPKAPTGADDEMHVDI
jgi:hypothetical protein